MKQYNLLGKIELIFDFSKNTERVSTDLLRMLVSIRNYYLSRGTITDRQFKAIDRIYIQVEQIIIKDLKQPIL